MNLRRALIFRKRMPQAALLSLLALLFWVCTGARPANASSITINFNSASLTNGDTSQTGIANYIDSLLPAGASVTVSGAQVDVGNTYTGDGHVTGTVSGSTVTPLTLGDTNGCAAANSSCAAGASETFLQNDTNAGDNEITLTFSGINITAVSFDYEIFPNGSCTQLSPTSDCGGTGDPDEPTLQFTDGSTNQTFDSYAPGTVEGGSATDTHSTNSGSGGKELAPQALGVSGTIAVSGDTMNFIDWPATIGIDNLVLTYNTPPAPVPEPSSLLLLGTGLLGVAELYNRKRKAAAKA